MSEKPIVCIHFPKDGINMPAIITGEWFKDEPLTFIDDPRQAQVIVTNDIDTILNDECRDPQVRKYLYCGNDYERILNFPNVRVTTMMGKTQILQVIHNQPYTPADVDLWPV